jgi:hypothetical protein
MKVIRIRKKFQVFYAYPQDDTEIQSFLSVFKEMRKNCDKQKTAK